MLLYTIDLLSQLDKNGKVTKKTVPAPYMEFPENFDVSKVILTLFKLNQRSRLAEG